MSKNHILKPITEEDINKIKDFFVEHKDIYEKDSITVSQLMRFFPCYRDSDIRAIISNINLSKEEIIILGFGNGYRIVTKNNRIWALLTINKKQDRANKEISNLRFIKSKVRNV